MAIYDSNCFGAIPENATHWVDGWHVKANKTRIGMWFRYYAGEWINWKGAEVSDSDKYQAIRNRDEAEQLAHNKKMKKSAAAKQIKLKNKRLGL